MVFALENVPHLPLSIHLISSLPSTDSQPSVDSLRILQMANLSFLSALIQAGHTHTPWMTKHLSQLCVQLQLCIDKSPPFALLCMHHNQIPYTSALSLSHPEPGRFLWSGCQEHCGSLSFIPPDCSRRNPPLLLHYLSGVLTKGAAAVCLCFWSQLGGCAAGPLCRFKYSNEFLLVTHFYGFFTIFYE